MTSSVATDILGVTGRSILAELLGGNEDAKSLAGCAKGTLRRKKDQLEQALQAKLTSHQRFMLREFLDDLKFVEGKIARLEETIQERVTPNEEVLNQLNTIPGINHLTASTLIAELGVEMQQFPDARHLASCKIVPAGAEMAACHAFDFPGSDEGGEATASFDLCPACQCSWWLPLEMQLASYWSARILGPSLTARIL